MIKSKLFLSVIIEEKKVDVLNFPMALVAVDYCLSDYDFNWELVVIGGDNFKKMANLISRLRFVKGELSDVLRRARSDYSLILSNYKDIQSELENINKTISFAKRNYQVIICKPTIYCYSKIFLTKEPNLMGGGNFFHSQAINVAKKIDYKIKYISGGIGGPTSKLLFGSKWLKLIYTSLKKFTRFSEYRSFF